jgi:hypothetical protein
MATSFWSRADTRVAGGCITAAPAGLWSIPNTPSTMPRQRLRKGIDILSCQDSKAHHQCGSCWVYERISGDVRSHMTRLSLTDKPLVVKSNVCLQKYLSIPEAFFRLFYQLVTACQFNGTVHSLSTDDIHLIRWHELVLAMLVLAPILQIFWSIKPINANVYMFRVECTHLTDMFVCLFV